MAGVDIIEVYRNCRKDRVGRSFEVFVLLVRERSLVGLDPLVGEGLNLGLVHLDLLGLEGESLDKVEVRVSNKGPEDPEEGLLVLVVALG